MKFVCSQSDLNSSLSSVSRAVPSRPTHPILANVLVVADAQKKRVSLTGFDLSLGIESSFSADVSEEGKITLPAKLLNDIVSRLSEGEITLMVEEAEEEEEETKIVSLESASGQFQVRTISADEFPPYPKLKKVSPLNYPLSC